MSDREFVMSDEIKSPDTSAAPRRPNRSGMAYKFVTALDLICIDETLKIRQGAVGIWCVDHGAVYFRPCDVIGATENRIAFQEYTILYGDNVDRWKFEPAF